MYLKRPVNLPNAAGHCARLLSLPRTAAVNTPSIARPAQARKAARKILAKVACSALTLDQTVRAHDAAAR